MYVRLLKRHLSIQRTVKELWLPCRLEQTFLPDGHFNESMLLAMLPSNWLPVPPGEILLSVAHNRGSTGLQSLSYFRPWGRHFDCFILELWHDGPRL